MSFNSWEGGRRTKNGILGIVGVVIEHGPHVVGFQERWYLQSFACLTNQSDTELVRSLLKIFEYDASEHFRGAKGSHTRNSWEAKSRQLLPYLRVANCRNTGKSQPLLFVPPAENQIGKSKSSQNYEKIIFNWSSTPGTFLAYPQYQPLLVFRFCSVPSCHCLVVLKDGAGYEAPLCHEHSPNVPETEVEIEVETELVEAEAEAEVPTTVAPLDIGNFKVTFKL
jgi:hypothetical protein